MAARPTVRTIHSQRSWVIRNDQVELAVTCQGGHVAPVTFYRGGDGIQPYYISPWQDEKASLPAAVLEPLRGNFFCMPFGDNARAWRGESHEPHGETACRCWELVDYARAGGATSLTLEMATRVRTGRVTRTHSLLDGQNAVYTRCVLEGFSGRMPLGFHATLRPPGRGVLRVATSAFKLGMTCPGVFSDPAHREYQCFAPGKRFGDLSKVPSIWRETPHVDASTFPIRRGYCDLLSVFKKPGKAPAWTTATAAGDGYLWFSLKDAAVLPATAMWVSDGGRHGAPWNGRNQALGLEDVCAYFARGLADSLGPNAISAAGFPTALALSPKRPTVVNYIEGAVKIPRGFDIVADVAFDDAAATFISASGKKAVAPVKHAFLYGGEPTP